MGDYNGPFNGTACDYATTGQYSTCTGTAEVWLKTSKYKQLCRLCAHWAKQQQDQSSKYTSSFSEASSSTLPWSTGTETYTSTEQARPPCSRPTGTPALGQQSRHRCRRATSEGNPSQPSRMQQDLDQ
jgi:hypothetical protein